MKKFTHTRGCVAGQRRGAEEGEGVKGRVGGGEVGCDKGRGHDEGSQHGDSS